jgi:hypothetical protein
MAKEKETKTAKKETKKGFSKTVEFVLPFEGSFQAGFTGKQYNFRVRTKQLWPNGKHGSKTPVKMEIDNEVVYNWLKKFEAVRA